MRERNRAHGSCYFLTFFFFESGSDYFDVVFVQSESTVKRQPGPLNLGGCRSGPFFKAESNVRHRPCLWFGAFGHLLARCSGVVGARFLASWFCLGPSAEGISSWRSRKGAWGAKIGILRSFQHRWPKHGPNIAPKRAQHGPGQHRPKISAQNGPTWPNIGPRWAQDGSTWARLGPT